MLAASLLTSLVLALANEAEPLPDLFVLSEAVSAFHTAGIARERPEEARKHYRTAAAFCEALLTRGFRSADLYCNLGNAYLLAGDLPRAILAYRRGLVLAPNDDRLRANLETAREQVAFPAHATLGRPPVDHWPPWLSRPSPRVCVWLAALGYVVGCLAATRWWMVRQGRLLLLAGAAFAVSFILAVFLHIEERKREDAIRYPLVVVAENGILLRKGNGLTYLPRYETPLPRGVEARLRFARGDWLQIELAGGECGWVLKEHVVLDPS